jgi:predicted phage terminase large subunit-like protein
LGRQPGEALWPGKYDLEALNRIKTALGGYEWDALYQQRPRQLEGALIKAHKITRIDRAEVPDDLRVVRYWDLAVSGRETADYIVGGQVGRAADGRLYILDVARFKGPWADARPVMIKVMVADDAAVEQGIEVAGQQGGYYQELKRDARLQLRSIVPVNPREVGSKEVRANVWASRIEDGLVYMVKAPWNDAFVAECVGFPRGRHDDQVDAVSGAIQMLGGSGWTDWARQQLMDAEANSGA